MKYKTGDIVLIHYSHFRPPNNYAIGYYHYSSKDKDTTWSLLEIITPKKGSFSADNVICGWDAFSFLGSNHSQDELDEMTKYSGKFWHIADTDIVCKIDPNIENLDNIISIINSEDVDAQAYIIEVLKQGQYDTI